MVTVKRILIALAATVILASFSIVENKDVLQNSDDREIDCTGITEEDEDEIQNVAMLFDDVDLLKDHLNQEVLGFMDRLEEEINMAERLTCLELEDNENLAEEKTKIYLMMLDYYHEILKNDDEVIVEELTFDESGGFFSQSLEAVLSDKRQLEIISYYDFSAYLRYSPDGLNDMEEALEEMDQPVHMLNIITTDVINQLYIFFLNPLQGAFEDGIPSYFSGKNDLDWENKMIDVRSGFGSLDFKMFVAEGDLELRSNLENESRWRMVSLFPRQSTVEMLERWEELHKLNSNIPFPEKLIKEEKWVGVAKFFAEHRGNINEIGWGITDYIYSGSTHDREVEDIANGVDPES